MKMKITSGPPLLPSGWSEMLCGAQMDEHGRATLLLAQPDRFRVESIEPQRNSCTVTNLELYGRNFDKAKDLPCVDPPSPVRVSLRGTPGAMAIVRLVLSVVLAAFALGCSSPAFDISDEDTAIAGDSAELVDVDAELGDRPTSSGDSDAAPASESGDSGSTSVDAPLEAAGDSAAGVDVDDGRCTTVCIPTTTEALPLGYFCGRNADCCSGNCVSIGGPDHKCMAADAGIAWRECP